MMSATIIGYAVWYSVVTTRSCASNQTGVKGRAVLHSGVPRNFFGGGVFNPGFFGGGGGVQQIQLRTEDRENGDLEAVYPSQGFWRQL
jgi:hypothetical protein